MERFHFDDDTSLKICIEDLFQRIPVQVHERVCVFEEWGRERNWHFANQKSLSVSAVPSLLRN